MIQHGERLRLARETLSKLRIVLPLRREHLERDEAAERFLPRLVHHAHPAAAEALVDLELGKMRRDGFDRERFASTARLIAGHCGVGAKVQRHDAARAETGGRIGGKRRAALWAVWRSGLAHAL